ncbi:MAG TPA: hypothetical protein VJ736_07435 [Actinomycetota bacterium]|jgi:hypothetical protein|nr:hypothetical protein [Actinomycetota bacterium]
MKRFLPMIGAAMLILATPLMAYADSVSWTGGVGVGSDVLPCTDGGHWVLSDAQAVQSATLVVGAGTYDMHPDSTDAFSTDSSGPIAVGDVAIATFDGGGQASLSLTSCAGSSSPSPDPSPTPTPSPSDSPPPSSTPPPGSGHTGGGSGGTGGVGSSHPTPVIRGGAGGGRDAPPASSSGHETPSQRDLRHLSSKHGPLPAAIHRALTPDPSHADPPANVGVGAANGAVQEAWNDGASDPFQAARHPPRGLVIAVIAVVAIGVGAAFAARRHLIHATT